MKTLAEKKVQIALSEAIGDGDGTHEAQGLQFWRLDLNSSSRGYISTLHRHCYPKNI